VDGFCNRAGHDIFDTATALFDAARVSREMKPDG
jgi:hypothetical protein